MMDMYKSSNNRWKDCRIGITGAKGSLGKALIEKLRSKGAFVIGLTHGPIPITNALEKGPNEWVLGGGWLSITLVQ